MTDEQFLRALKIQPEGVVPLASELIALDSAWAAIDPFSVPDGACKCKECYETRRAIAERGWGFFR